MAHQAGLNREQWWAVQPRDLCMVSENRCLSGSLTSWESPLLAHGATSDVEFDVDESARVLPASAASPSVERERGGGGTCRKSALDQGWRVHHD